MIGDLQCFQLCVNSGSKLDLLHSNSPTHCNPCNPGNYRARAQKDESPGALGSRPSFWKLIKNFSRMRRDGRHKPKTDLDRLLDAVQGLTNLTTLDIYLPHNFSDPFHAMKIKVLEAGWPVFSANLTTSSLDVPLEEVHLGLPSHNTPFGWRVSLSNSTIPILRQNPMNSYVERYCPFSLTLVRHSAC